MTDWSRRTTVVVLLLAGVAGWIAVFGPGRGVPWQAVVTLGPWGPGALAAAAVGIAALCWLGPVRRAASSPGVRRPWASVAAAVLAGPYLWLTAVQQHRQFFPYIHDESSYLIQVHQLARGHLWYPAHPLGAFFDSFQLLTSGVYASAYFPGTALLHVPGVWLGLPPWVTTLLAAAAVAGLLHWIISEMIDATAGWLAVLSLLSCQMFRSLSIVTVAQMPLLLFGLGAIFCWLKWRRAHRWNWAIALGGCIGLAAITRPVDALCLALPLGIAVLIEVRRPVTIALILLGMAPSLGLQLISNRGITGHWLTTPFRIYADRDYPGTAYGFAEFDPAARPQSTLPQKQLLYRQDVKPLVAAHRPQLALTELLRRRLPLTLSLGGATTPFPLLAMVLPVSMLGLGRGRWVLWAFLPLFLLLYLPYAFFFPGYTLTAAPAVILAPLIVARGIPRSRPAVVAGASLLIAVVALAALPQWDSSVDDEVFRAPLIASVNRQLATVQAPAVVLFRFSPNHNLNEEPVYNADVAWPDDAPVIRAHDLGPQRDGQLIAYYAARQPNRRIYRFDEADNSLHYLGTAGQLAGGAAAL